MFNSFAKQDQFIANLFNFKKEGCYLDIGSWEAVSANNTYFFDKEGWSGICVEIDSKNNIGYASRSCTYINADALTVDWKAAFKQKNLGKNIDYLSLDVDEASTEVLLNLPLDDYKFKAITIEHDAYLHGDTYKSPQKEHLLGAGYALLCEDVAVEQPGLFLGNTYDIKPLPFEDWWIHPEFFSEEVVKKLSCEGEYPSTIIAKFERGE